MKENFAKTFNGQKAVIIFAERFIKDVRQGTECLRMNFDDLDVFLKKLLMELTKDGFS